MAQHQPVTSARRPSVFAPGDFLVGATDADRQTVDEQLVGTGIGVGYLFDVERFRLFGLYRQCLHGELTCRGALVANQKQLRFGNDCERGLKGAR